MFNGNFTLQALKLFEGSQVEARNGQSGPHWAVRARLKAVYS